MAARTYVYRWAKCLGMPVLGGERKGQLCKLLVRGKRNSCLIEFSDGLQAVTSRNALRKAIANKFPGAGQLAKTGILIPAKNLNPATSPARKVRRYA